MKSDLITAYTRGHVKKILHQKWKIMRIHHFFLIFAFLSGNIVYNAVSVDYTPWQIVKTLKALPNGRAFLHIHTFERRLLMAVSYKKLWKLLIDKDMKKKDLCAKAGISSSSITKMGKNGHVTTEVLLKICTALECQVEDIMEFIPEDK